MIVSSAAEAEIAGCYLSAQAAVPIRTALIELHHPQPPTPIQLDNTTAVGFANAGIKQRRSKAMDMRWYWIQDRVLQKQFLVYYRPGVSNLGDPFTKHHPPSHLRLVRPFYLQPTSHTAHLANVVIAHLVQGCVNPPRARAVRAAGGIRLTPGVTRFPTGGLFPCPPIPIPTVTQSREKPQTLI